MDSKKDINNYVCPSCFNQIECCTCLYPPYNLIMIDKTIQWAIKKLNNQHKITIACCGGHYVPNEMSSIYISFQTKPKTAPLEWFIRGNGIYYICFPKNEIEWKMQQKKQFNHLQHWIE